MKLLTRKQKTSPTAGASAERTRLPSIRQQMQKSSPTAGASAATGDPFTYAEAMESPQRDHWKRAMEEESTLILLNNTFSALNSREARQLQVKPIGSKLVYETIQHPDGSTLYKARLVKKGYEQMYFGET